MKHFTFVCFALLTISSGYTQLREVIKGDPARKTILDGARSWVQDPKAKHQVVFLVDCMYRDGDYAAFLGWGDNEWRGARLFTEGEPYLFLLKKEKGAWRLKYLYCDPHEGDSIGSGTLFDFSPVVRTAWVPLIEKCRVAGDMTLPRVPTDIQRPILGGYLSGPNDLQARHMPVKLSSLAELKSARFLRIKFTVQTFRTPEQESRRRQ